MTTDNATANNAQTLDDAEAKARQAAVDKAAAEVAAESQEEGKGFLTAAELDARLEAKLKPTVDAIQGRAQRWYGDKVKETAAELKARQDAELEAMRSNFASSLDEDQREEFLAKEALRQKEAEQEKIAADLEYVRKIRSGEVVPGQAQPEAPAMSGAEIELLREEVADLIEGTDIELDSKSLWDGWAPSMTHTQSLTLARRNRRKLLAQTKSDSGDGKPASAAPKTASDAVPPTTQTLDASSIEGMTMSEAASAFARGELNSNDYRKLGKQKGWFR